MNNYYSKFNSTHVKVINPSNDILPNKSHFHNCTYAQVTSGSSPNYSDDPTTPYMNITILRFLKYFKLLLYHYLPQRNRKTT